MSYLVPRGKVRKKRTTVFLLLIGISTVLHSLLLGFLFFAYQYDTVLAHITLHKDMPLVKFVPQSAVAPKAIMQPKTMLAANSKSTSATTIASTAPKPEPVEQVLKEDTSKGTRAALISPAVEKKAQKKPVASKKKKEVKKQKTAPKAKTSTKEKTKVEKPPKELVAEKKIEKKIVEEKKPAENNAIVTQQPVKETDAPVATAQAEQALPAGTEIAQEVVLAIGEVIDDPRLLQYYTQLQHAVSDSWKPPVGISDECVCDVLIQLDAQGKPKDIKIVKSSGVLIYDMAARNALQDAKMPKWTFGKSITVSFKQ